MHKNGTKVMTDYGPGYIIDELVLVALGNIAATMYFAYFGIVPIRAEDAEKTEEKARKGLYSHYLRCCRLPKDAVIIYSEVL